MMYNFTLDTLARIKSIVSLYLPPEIIAVTFLSKGSPSLITKIKHGDIFIPLFFLNCRYFRYFILSNVLGACKGVIDKYGRYGVLNKFKHLIFAINSDTSVSSVTSIIAIANTLLFGGITNG